MWQINSNSIDTIAAMELFEHVKEIEKGIDECFRGLKPNGHMLISVSFLYPIHANPFDYQRWALDKWKTTLTSKGFEVIEYKIMGRAFTLIADILKIFI